MKKTLVAVAAVVAATGAIAGNSVTLYGIADVHVGSFKDIGVTKTRSQTKVESGGLSSSRLGVKVKEELGGGLYAKVKFERGLKVDTGVNSGPRETWLGLGGDFGELRLGYNDSSFSTGDYVDVAQDSKYSAVAGHEGAWDAAYGGADPSRIDSSIKYVTPNLDGFSASAVIGLGENKPATETADRYAFSVGYDSGPFGIGFAYDRTNNAGNVDPSVWALGAYYDFGQFRLNGGLGRVDHDMTGRDDSNLLNIGASFNVENVYVAASIARATDVGANDIDQTNFGIEGRYNLSKRTTAYAGFVHAKREDHKAKGRLISVGLRHKF